MLTSSSAFEVISIFYINFLWISRSTFSRASFLYSYFFQYSAKGSRQSVEQI